MGPNDSFPLFSTLPAELRFKIWSFAFSEPVVVGFSSRENDIELVTVDNKPILRPDHSPIAQACKEAWRLRRATHVLTKFTTNIPLMHCETTAWIDYSRTVFYVGCGSDSRSILDDVLEDNPNVQNVAILWSTYTNTIHTTARLRIFPSLRRVIFLISPWQDLGNFPRFLEAKIDLHGSSPSVERQAQRPFMNSDLSMYVGTPLLETDRVKMWFEGYVRKQALSLGRPPPVVETIVSLAT
jgi:hypothetical protein